MRCKEIVSEDRGKWLSWRWAGIGSSDAAIIMGVSRFKTRDQLLLEKAGLFKGEDGGNEFIKNKGNKIEGHVREFIEQQDNCKYPAVAFESESFPFMRASLDGWNEETKTIVEIKLLSVQNPAKVNTETAGYKKWEVLSHGLIPNEYYPQVQHQLMVTGAGRVLFEGYKEIKGEYFINRKKLLRVEVTPELEYIEQLAIEEFRFWFEVEQLRNKQYKGELE